MLTACMTASQQAVASTCSASPEPASVLRSKDLPWMGLFTPAYARWHPMWGRSTCAAGTRQHRQCCSRPASTNAAQHAHDCRCRRCCFPFLPLTYPASSDTTPSCVPVVSCTLPASCIRACSPMLCTSLVGRLCGMLSACARLQTSSAASLSTCHAWCCQLWAR